MNEATHILEEIRRTELGDGTGSPRGCRSGNRSGRAVGMMQQAGLKACNVRGGMIAWSRAGLPVSKR